MHADPSPGSHAAAGTEAAGTEASEAPAYLYEPVERFGEGLTSDRPWNTTALAAVERLNGRVAMLGFLAAVLGEGITGKGIVGQLAGALRWFLG